MSKEKILWVQSLRRKVGFVSFLLFFFFSTILYASEKIVYKESNCSLVENKTANQDTSNTDRQISELHGFFGNGQSFADEISKTAGISISPLLGLTVRSAYVYYKTPEMERINLPWYYSPEFWTPALIILIIIISKDFLATILPIQLLKKPLDAVENLESMISGILGIAIVVLPLLAKSGLQLSQLLFPQSSIFSSQLASANVFLSLSTIPLFLVGIIIFLVIWLASHSLNVLILLSPFAIIDLFLRFLRIFIIGMLLICTAIHPYLGLFFALLIAYLSYRILGWSLRLLIFGSIFSYDILLRKNRKTKLVSNVIKAFSTKAISGIAPRTYGLLQKDDDSKISFQYKPWLIGRIHSLTIQDSSENLAVGKGLIHPIILKSSENKKTHTTFFRLPPRYKSHEQELVDMFGFNSTREVALAKGLRALRSWLKEQMERKEQKFIKEAT